MPFRPNVNDTVNINGLKLQFTEHPSAPGMPYGQTGRRATVYQVRAGQGTYSALKVFAPAFRTPRIAAGAERLRPHAQRPGLKVCDRLVITPEHQAPLLVGHGDLAYSVVMPWVAGDVWQEIVLGSQPLLPDSSLAIALELGNLLALMEKDGLAHCDLAGPNVIITVAPASVTLIDVEDMFAPGLLKPETLPGGTPGYAHRASGAGLWGREVDRFAGAVLLAEILGWCDDRVRQIAYGETYFDPDEMQTNSERYQVLLAVLRERWGAAVYSVFARAWFAAQLGDCPTLGDWHQALAQHHGSGETLAHVTSAAGARPELAPLPAPKPTPDMLRSRAYRLAGYGRWDEVIQVCEQILETWPSETDILPILGKARRLMTIDADVHAAAAQSILSGRSADWNRYLELLHTARHFAPNVFRYGELQEQAEREMSTALLAERAEHLVRTEEWDEAKAVLDEVPADHPVAARVLAQIDMELQRRANVAGQLQAVQAASTAKQWAKAVLAAQHGLALGGDAAVFTPLLQQAQREHRLEEQVRKHADQADQAAAARDYAVALEQLSQALALQPEQPELQARRERFLLEQQWLQCVKTAAAAAAHGQWANVLATLSGVPRDFVDAGSLCQQAEQNLQWEASLSIAHGLHDTGQVAALLAQPPSGALSSQTWSDWLGEAQAREARLQAALSRYDFAAVDLVLSQLPDGYARRGELERWLAAEQAFARRLAAARQAYAIGDVADLIAATPADYPERNACLAWVAAETARRQALEDARRAYSPGRVLECLRDAPEDYPNKRTLLDWAQAEQEHAKRLANAQATYALEAVEALLAEMPDDHPARGNGQAWLSREQERRAALAVARQDDDVRIVQTLLAEVGDLYPQRAELLAWALTEAERQHQLQNARNIYDVRHVAALLDELADTSPVRFAFADWLSQEEARAQALAEARAAFDSERVQELLNDVRESYPERADLLAWANDDQSSRRALSQALARRDSVTAARLLETVPAEHPQREHWSQALAGLRAHEERLRQQYAEAQAALAEQAWTRVIAICQAVQEIDTGPFDFQSLLRQALAGTDYEQTVHQAREAVAQGLATGDVGSAWRAAAAAVSHYPDAAELKGLIDEVRAHPSIRDPLAKAQSATAAGQWREAVTHYRSLQAMGFTDTASAEGLARSLEAVALEESQAARRRRQTTVVWAGTFIAICLLGSALAGMLAVGPLRGWWQTSTPTPTASLTAAPTDDPTPRPTRRVLSPQPPATATTTVTPSPSSTRTASPSATRTPSPTSTATPTPTATRTRVIVTAVPQPTITGTPTPTNLPPTNPPDLPSDPPPEGPPATDPPPPTPEN